MTQTHILIQMQKVYAIDEISGISMFENALNNSGV